jgi:hypothetical protein
MASGGALHGGQARGIRGHLFFGFLLTFRETLSCFFSLFFFPSSLYHRWRPTEEPFLVMKYPRLAQYVCSFIYLPRCGAPCDLR